MYAIGVDVKLLLGLTVAQIQFVCPVALIGLNQGFQPRSAVGPNNI